MDTVRLHEIQTSGSVECVPQWWQQVGKMFLWRRRSRSAFYPPFIKNFSPLLYWCKNHILRAALSVCYLKGVALNKYCSRCKSGWQLVKNEMRGCLLLRFYDNGCQVPFLLAKFKKNTSQIMWCQTIRWLNFHRLFPVDLLSSIPHINIQTYKQPLGVTSFQLNRHTA